VKAHSTERSTLPIGGAQEQALSRPMTEEAEHLAGAVALDKSADDILTDVSDIKQSPGATRLTCDNLDTIIASLPAGILIVNSSGRVIYANTLVKGHLQPSRPQLVGHDIVNIVVGPWIRLPLELARAMQDRLRQWEGEVEAHGHTYRYRIFPVVINGGVHDQMGLLTWDVTEQRQLQEQLVQAQKLTSVGRLVFDVAHEINSPLQGILGIGEMLLDESDPGTIREYAQDILQCTNHIAAVVRELAVYARPASRDVETDVYLSERLVEAVKMVRRNACATGIEVLYQLAIVPPIRARRSEIDQILVNLISNAIQAMNGSGKLRIATELHAGTIRAHIADTGCGIPKHLLNSIFDAFFTTKEPGKGTGLGLSIVQRLVKKYHGTVNVQSEEQKGTTVTVEFPVLSSSE
jgi:signal transduction histidine kinase